MKTIALALILVLFASGCSHKLDDDSNVLTPQIQEAAQKAAEQWLALVDSGNWPESWTTSASYFQKSVSHDLWNRKMEVDRKPLGDLLSRRFKSAEFTESVPGAPSGEFVILQFDSSFANKLRAVEIVTPMLDTNGIWKVAGYYIK